MFNAELKMLVDKSASVELPGEQLVRGKPAELPRLRPGLTHACRLKVKSSRTWPQAACGWFAKAAPPSRSKTPENGSILGQAVKPSREARPEAMTHQTTGAPLSNLTAG